MSTYTLKSVVRRGSMLGAAFALAAATVAPLAPSTYADALNPLTDRSLALSSSSPGWDFLDGSGNATYAPPNSGANGQKTGNTFAFKVSTDTTLSGVGDPKVEAITFQYCTKSAGDCMGPGNIPFDGTVGSYTRAANGPIPAAAQQSDLEIVFPTPVQIEQATLATYINTTGVNAGTVKEVPTATGNFIVMYNNAGTWTSSDGWTLTTQVNQTIGGVAGTVADGTSSGKSNQITLVNETGQGFTAGQEVKVLFFGTANNYITNPGLGEFFVKINTFKEVDNTTPAAPVVDMDDVIDGGVTVANVMNQSIHIVTKVLETMDFSVGTVDPYTLEALELDPNTSQLYTATGNGRHGACDPIVRGMDRLNPTNTLQLGDATGEFSLATAHTYSTHSYWRLSSNSSAGATVYYSGVTLQNTVGDDIAPIAGGTGAAAAPQRGMEQFGLALAHTLNGVTNNLDVNYDVERRSTPGVNPDTNIYGVFEGGADNLAAGILADPLNAGIHSSVTDDDISNIDSNASWHTPYLDPISPVAAYANGAGVVNPEYGTVNTQFAFDNESNTIPAPFATGTEVVDCVTGKMRYIANIAATTPAGIYTTKINYIAAPQY